MKLNNPARSRFVITLGCFLLAACSLRGASTTEVDEIADLLGLQAGQTLADVGAGDGDFAQGLAAWVGPEGRVLATEVKQDLVDDLEQRMLEAGLAQVVVKLGDQNSLGLSAGCCDAILLRLVYHHFEEPDKMRSDLWRALKPDGLLVIIDIKPQEDWRVLPGVPDRGGHGIPTSDLIAEMSGAGFELVETRPEWNGDEDRYAMLFRRPPGEMTEPPLEDVEAGSS